MDLKIVGPAPTQQFLPRSSPILTYARLGRVTCRGYVPRGPTPRDARNDPASLSTKGRTALPAQASAAQSRNDTEDLYSLRCRAPASIVSPCNLTAKRTPARPAAIKMRAPTSRAFARGASRRCRGARIRSRRASGLPPASRRCKLKQNRAGPRSNPSSQCLPGWPMLRAMCI